MSEKTTIGQSHHPNDSEQRTKKQASQKKEERTDKEQERFMTRIPLLYRNEALTRLLIDLFISKKERHHAENH